MVSAVSDVDICNFALDILREGPIGSLGDDDDRADWFNRNFTQTRDELLVEHPWNFAIRYAALAADEAAPLSEWDYAYVLPADCLRLLPLAREGKFEGQPRPFEVIANRVETDETAPLKIRYIARIDETGQFSTLFVKALAAALAVKAGHWITGKASQVQLAQSIFEDAVAKAKRVDGQEGWMERAYDDDVITIRG